MKYICKSCKTKCNDIMEHMKNVHKFREGINESLIIFYGKQAISILKNNNHTLSLTYDPNWLEIWAKRFNRPLDDAESFQIDLKTVVAIA